MRHEIKFSSTKLVIGLILAIAALPLAAALLGSDRNKVQFAGVVILICGPIVALMCLRWLMSSKPAIAFDAQQLMVTSLWRRHELRWSDVAEIGVGTTSTYAAYGLVKTSSQNDLYIHVKNGRGGTRKIRVPLSFLSLPNGLAGLLDDLDQAGRGLLPAAAPTPSPAMRQPDPQSGNFDADAALARYLAKSAQATPSAALPRAGGFGRKGL
jgi:hypothetical protein